MRGRVAEAGGKAAFLQLQAPLHSRHLQQRLRCNITREVKRVRLQMSRASGPVAQLGSERTALDWRVASGPRGQSAFRAEPAPSLPLPALSRVWIRGNQSRQLQNLGGEMALPELSRHVTSRKLW